MRSQVEIFRILRTSVLVSHFGSGFGFGSIGCFCVYPVVIGWAA